MPESLDFMTGEDVVSWMDNVYRVVKPLGQGGSANTYLALCLTGKYKGLTFAVKLFRNVSKPDRIINFMREINFLRSCEHPALMKVFDEGIYLENYPFVVVEYLPQTLHDVIRAKTAFLKKVSYSLNLLSALDYLQRLDPPVIHRDIKPKNTFVKGGTCILGDFGLMKSRQTDDEDRKIVMESHGPRMPRFYRTPDLVEYLNGGPRPTTSSDVFQLGLVLAELFTGSNPEKPMGRGGFRSRVELRPLGNVDHPLWLQVKSGIQGMLDFNRETRPTPEVLVKLFIDFYLSETRRIEEEARRPKQSPSQRRN
jgi:serine/threonine protein kinase